jgi:hypothetical protein
MKNKFSVAFVRCQKFYKCGRCETENMEIILDVPRKDYIGLNTAS